MMDGEVLGVTIDTQIICPLGFVVREAKTKKVCDCGHNECFPASCERLRRVEDDGSCEKDAPK